MIRVFVADDQTLVRQGIKGLLALLPDIAVVGEAGDGEEALARVPGAKPDVLMLDVRMPKLDGIGVLKALRAWDRLPPTLVLTTFDDAEAAFDAVRAGAKGYMLKDVTLDDLASSLRVLASGGTAIHPNLTERLLNSAAVARRPDRPLPLEPLSKREKDVLRLIAGGYSNREIADMLDLAEGTVKNHVSTILVKLDARDRTQAVLRAIESGCMPLTRAAAPPPQFAPARPHPI